MTVVKPSSLGFADDGELWRSLGGTEGLILALEKKSLAIRDWFVTAEWATEAQVRSHALPAKATVHPLQDYVNVERVNAYRETADHCLSIEGEMWETFPSLFQWNGKLFIFQGTHRLEAAYSLARQTFSGWLINLDEL